MADVNDVKLIKPLKFGDNWYRGFGLAEGPSLPFFINELRQSSLQHSRYRVTCDNYAN